MGQYRSTILYSLTIVLGLGPYALASATTTPDEPYVRPYEGLWTSGSGSGTLPEWEQPGSGIMLDVQDDTLVAAIFTYRADGSPTWYLASGPLEKGAFEGKAFEFHGGACLGCAWTPAEAIQSIEVRLEFVGETLGWLTIDGSEPLAIRVLPYGSPMWDEYSDRSATHGQYAMYGVRGRWIAVGLGENQNFVEQLDMNYSMYLDPGGIAYHVIDDHFFTCYSPSIIGTKESMCLYEESGGSRSDPIFSLFWGDHGPKSATGYMGSPKTGAEDVRGSDVLRMFRLTGPPATNEEYDHGESPYIETGNWMIPGEPGSGLMLDWQGPTLGFTIFTYDQSGNPIWYLGSGAIEENLVKGEAFQFFNGSCLGCEYEGPPDSGNRIEVHFEFMSKSTAWLTVGENDAVPIRALSFDSPVHRQFGIRSEFGMPALNDLRGEWVFVSTEGEDAFFRRLTFDKPSWARGGETVAWKTAENDASFRCDSRPDKWASPQCRLIVRQNDRWKRLFSAHWADVGEDQIIGYEGRPLSGDAGITRGEELIFGFRLSGPN